MQNICGFGDDLIMPFSEKRYHQNCQSFLVAIGVDIVHINYTDHCPGSEKNIN